MHILTIIVLIAALTLTGCKKDVSALSAAIGQDNGGHVNGNDRPPTVAGMNGKTSLIVMVRDDTIRGCDGGSGLIVYYGVDENDDGELDTSEVTTYTFLCDGRVL